jgi:hypothetical protein
MLQCTMWLQMCTHVAHVRRDWYGKPLAIPIQYQYQYQQHSNVNMLGSYRYWYQSRRRERKSSREAREECSMGWWERCLSYICNLQDARFGGGGAPCKGGAPANNSSTGGRPAVVLK